MDRLPQARNTGLEEDAGVQMLVLDFLERCRELGKPVRLRDMEPVLERLGIPLNGFDHFILLLADWESGNDSGFHRPASALMEDYPAWKHDIKDHLRILSLVSKCRPRSREKHRYRSMGYHLEN
jgi:hypothetical protein